MEGGDRQDVTAEGEKALRVLWTLTHSDIGGVPTQALRLMPALAPFRIEVFLAAPGTGSLFSDLARSAAAALPVHLARISLLHVISISRFCRRHQIDILHSHGKGAGLITRLAATALRLPVVHSFRGFSTLRFGRAQRWLYCQLERLLARMSAQIVAVSPSEAEGLARAGIVRDGGAVVIANGLDCERLRGEAYSRKVARMELDLPPSGRVVGTVARADRAKGLEVFVDIAAEVTAADPTISFLVVGVDPTANGYPASLRARAAELGVHVTWVAPRSDAWRLMPAFDLYLSTSLTEGLPNGPLEASALGIPVLLSDVQGNRNALIPGKTGELFPLGDPQRAAALISAWDPPGFRNAQDAGPAFVREHFLIEQQAQALAALYRRVASTSPRAE